MRMACTMILAALTVGAVGLGWSVSAQATACTANQVSDLRNAIASAQSGDTIQLNACDYDLGGIPLTVITGITLKGEGSDQSRLKGNGNRVIIINESMNDHFPDVTLESLSIMSGQAPDLDYGGGGVYADTGLGTLTLRNVVLEDNAAGEGGSGAGLYISGPAGGELVLEKVVLRNNEAESHGGGLFLDGDLDLTVRASTFESNKSLSGSGGGIAFLPLVNSGKVVIEGSTFVGNRAEGMYGTGGGLAIAVRDTTVLNSTFSGNFARDGGGGIIAAADQPSGVTKKPRLIHVTIADNESEKKAGAGLYIAAGKPELLSSIVSDNSVLNIVTENKDIGVGAIAKPLELSNIQYNVIGSAKDAFTDHEGKTNAGTNGIHMNAGLLPLGDNGGNTRTHALAADSPARGAGGPVRAEAERDQRGFPRLLAAKTAAGAVEGLRDSVRYNKEFTETLHLRGASSLTAERQNETPAGLIGSDLPLTVVGQTRELTVIPSGNSVGSVTYVFTASFENAGVTEEVSGTLVLDVTASPDLETKISYGGIFYQGQQDAEYTVTVTNKSIVPTTGDMTLAIGGHASYTITGISGTGWTCSLPAGPCTRTNPLGAGLSSELKVSFDVREDAVSSAVIQAEATLEADENKDNDQDSVTVQVLPVPRMEQVELPADGLYKAGDMLDYTVRYDRDVTVDTVNGSPSLTFDVGGEVKQAVYVSGSGGRDLRFEYVIESGIQDNDGITINALTLNGGAITSTAGAPARLDLQGVGPTTDIKVDAKAPSITGVNLPDDGLYKKGAELHFGILLDEAITVAGEPKLLLEVGGMAVEAVMNAATTNMLTFTYTVQEGHNDSDGISLASLQVNGGSIRDAAGNDAVISLPGETDMPGVRIDSVSPAVSELVKETIDGVYKAGDIVSFRAVFTEQVVVSGSPRIVLSIGQEQRYAEYDVDESSSSELKFNYAVQPGDNDEDGISFASGNPLEAGGSVRDAAGNDADLTVPSLPAVAGIRVDTTAPYITSATVEETVYLSGDTISVEVQFNEPVTIAGGTPKLTLMMDGSMREATFAHGSGTDTLRFDYELPDGIEENNGITLGSSLQLNISTIEDGVGNAAVVQLPQPLERNVTVDTIKPVALSVTAAGGYYLSGDKIAYQVKFNEPVIVAGQPELAFVIASTELLAMYQSGSGTDTLVFEYVVEDHVGNGESVDLTATTAIALNSGSIKDALGNEALVGLAGVIGDMSGVVVDSTIPNVANMTADNAAGLYKVGDTLTFRLQLSEPVLVDTQQGDPALQLFIGDEIKQVVYDSAASSGNELVFIYTIVEGDSDSDGVQTGAALQLNGAAIKDLRGNALNPSLPTISLPELRVDGIPPDVSEVEFPEDGAYRSGQTLEFVLVLSEQVTVQSAAASNSPSLELDIGGASASAIYVADSDPADRMVFRYTIRDGDADDDGIALMGQLLLNGAAIVDVSGNPLPLVLPISQPSQILTDIMVDTTAPAAPIFTTASGAVFYTSNAIISGTAEPGAIVRVTAAKQSSAGMVTAGVDGSWSVTLTGLANGKADLVATATDKAGNVSLDAALAITIDLNPGGVTTMPGNNLQLVLDGLNMTVVIHPQDIAKGRLPLPFDTHNQLLLKLSPETLKELLKLHESLELELTTKRGTLIVPLAEIEKQAVKQAQAELRSMELIFASSQGEAAASIQKALAHLGAKALADPTVYAIRYQDVNGKEGQLSTLKEASSMTFVIGPDKPAYGSIVARWNAASSKLEFVPATFTKKNDMWAAQLDGGRMDNYVILHHTAAFADTAKHWARTEVELLASMLVVEGRGNGEFNPNSSITRAEFTALITRLLGLDTTLSQNTFADISGQWYEGSVAAASAVGLVTGYGDGVFRPEAKISRQEMAVMLLRAIRFIDDTVNAEGEFKPFVDQSGIAAWAEEAVQMAAGLGIAMGDEKGSFRPVAEATRAEAAVMLLRLMRTTELTEW